MPECTEIVALLSDYLDRDLPPESCSVVQAHLDSCESCRNASEGLRRTVGLCKQYRSDSAPGPLEAEKESALRAAFEKALLQMRQSG